MVSQKSKYDELMKKYGVKRATTFTNNGKQSISASPSSNKGNSVSPNNSSGGNSKYDELMKKHGVKRNYNSTSFWRKGGLEKAIGFDTSETPKTTVSNSKPLEILALELEVENEKSKTTDEYYEKRYQEEFERIKSEHPNDYAYPAGAHASGIVLDEMKTAKAKIRELEKQIKEFTTIYENTSGILSKPDFEQNSKYSPITPKTDEELKAAGYKQAQSGEWYKQENFLSPTEWYAGEDSDLYTYINDESKRQAIEAAQTTNSSKANPGGSVTIGISTYDEFGYDTLYEDEIGVFNYLYHQDRKNGTNTAEEFIEKMSPILQKRKMAKDAEYYAELGKESPVFMSLLSLSTNLQNAAMFPVKTTAVATGTYDDTPLLDKYGNQTRAIRGGVSEDMGYWGKMFYNGGMSIADMGVALAAGGGNPTITQAIMSSSAGSSAISEAKNNGASDTKALILGIGSAAIEWATEKWSVEAILADPKTIKGFILANTVTESTEEGASNVLNLGLDTIVSVVLGERNEIQQRIDYLVAYEGKTAEEALQIAVNEKAQSLGEDVFVGGLTGFGLSGAKSGYIGVNNAIKNRGVISTYIEDGKSLDALIEEGKASGEGSKPFSLAVEVEQAKANGTLKRGQIKNLIKANDAQINAEASKILSLSAENNTGDTTPAQAQKPLKTEFETVNEKAVEAAFEAGKANVPRNLINLATVEQEEAYNRGRIEHIKNMKPESATAEDVSGRMNTLLGDGERTVGVADGQAFVTNGTDIFTSPLSRSVFIPVTDVETAKSDYGATESNKTSENIDKILASDFAPVRKDFVDGNLKGVGEVRVYTDKNGRDIALEKNVAEYFEGYNLEATFRGGKPYAIKATDSDGNIAGVAMAIWTDTSGQKYNITDAKTVGKSNVPYNVMANDNPLLQERQAREAYIEKTMGYGRYGVQAFANIMETVSESEAPAIAKSFQAAYEAGLTNMDRARVELPSAVHNIAFNAGKQDFIMESASKKENLKNVRSHGDKAGLDPTNVPSKVSNQAKDIADRLCKELGVVAQMVGKSDEFNADISKNVGVVRIASDFTVDESLGEDSTSLSFLKHVFHEVADHRAEELAPAEYAEFKREMYNYLNSGHGVSEAKAKRKAYGEKGVDISLSEAMSEVTANSILELYDNDLDLLQQGLNRVLNGTNAKAKKGANVFKQALDYVIAKFNKLLETLGLKAKQTYKPLSDDILRIRDVFENTLGAAIAKNKEIAKTGRKISSKNLEIKTNEVYNKNIRHSLKWHTDLTKTQIKEVVKRLRQIGSSEATRITDTANWYKGRLNGQDLFVIYSTVYSNEPTILYERKGVEGKKELDILLEQLEEIENGRSIVEVSKDINTLLSGDWLQEKHNLANNNAGLGRRRSNTGYASILQGKSSEFIGSQAFRNVVKNLFDIQEETERLNEDKTHSLKSGLSDTEIRNAIANNKLSK